MCALFVGIENDGSIAYMDWVLPFGPCRRWMTTRRETQWSGKRCSRRIESSIRVGAAAVACVLLPPADACLFRLLQVHKFFPQSIAANLDCMLLPACIPDRLVQASLLRPSATSSCRRESSSLSEQARAAPCAGGSSGTWLIERGCYRQAPLLCTRACCLPTQLPAACPPTHLPARLPGCLQVAGGGCV